MENVKSRKEYIYYTQRLPFIFSSQEKSTCNTRTVRYVGSFVLLDFIFWNFGETSLLLAISNLDPLGILEIIAWFCKVLFITAFMWSHDLIWLILYNTVIIVWICRLITLIFFKNFICVGRMIEKGNLQFKVHNDHH